MNNTNPDVGFNLTLALSELIVMLSGAEPTGQQIAIYVKSLSTYPVEHVRDAFRETIEEDERFVFAKIMKRIRAMDGRPTAEAMWIEVQADEYKTIWQTEEANEAMPQSRMAALSEAITCNDRQQIAQIREAFKADYKEAVIAARKANRPIKWTESAGFDRDHREARMLEAVQLGRIGVERAVELIPGLPHVSNLPQIETTQAVSPEIKKLSSAMANPMPGAAQ